MKGSLDSLLSSDDEESTGGLSDAAQDVLDAIAAKDAEALATALQRFVTLADEDEADEGPDEE